LIRDRKRKFFFFFAWDTAVDLKQRRNRHETSSFDDSLKENESEKR